MIEISDQDENTCFISTSYNYIWKDKKCQQCPKLISDTPIYKPNKTDDLPPNITEIIPTDPVIIYSNKKCKCSLFLTFESCYERIYCDWDINLSTCINQQSPCNQKETELYCVLSGCVWTDNKCKKFTECSDYPPKDKKGCPINQGCFITTNNQCEPFDNCEKIDWIQCPEELGCVKSSYSCSKSLPCSSYSEDDCEGKYEKRNYPCYLDNDGNCKSKFTVVKFNICEDFDNSKTHCESMKGCAYIDNKCITGKCYQFIFQNCFIQRNSDGTQHQCDWDYTYNQCGYQKLTDIPFCNQFYQKSIGRDEDYSSTCYACQEFELEDLHLSIYSSARIVYFGNLIILLVALIY